MLAGVVFALFVVEPGRSVAKKRPFHLALRSMPSEFRRYLTGVGVFGAGDYAHTLLILAAMQLLAPRFGAFHAASLGALLYVWHNTIYALAAYPAGALADKHGHRLVLACGYAISVAVPVTLIGCFAASWGSLPALGGIFTIAGLVNGVQDTLEGAATGDLVPEHDRGLGFGLLGAVNGVGDLVSSVVVGALWTAEPTLGFGYAALCMALGAIMTFNGHRETARVA